MGPGSCTAPRAPGGWPAALASLLIATPPAPAAPDEPSSRLLRPGTRVPRHHVENQKDAHKTKRARARQQRRFSNCIAIDCVHLAKAAPGRHWALGTGATDWPLGARWGGTGWAVSEDGRPGYCLALCCSSPQRRPQAATMWREAGARWRRDRAGCHAAPAMLAVLALLLAVKGAQPWSAGAGGGLNPSLANTLGHAQEEPNLGLAPRKVTNDRGCGPRARGCGAGGCSGGWGGWVRAAAGAWLKRNWNRFLQSLARKWCPPCWRERLL